MNTLRRWLRPERVFGTIRTRLAVLYAGLFAAAMLIVCVVGQVMVVRHAEASVRSELAASGSIFDRLWAMRASSLADTADVMAHDFGFRSAVATGDRATIASATENIRRRAGVPYAFVVTQDGEVIGDGDAALRGLVAGLPAQFAPGRRNGVVTLGGHVYRTVISPILAPTEIGWVIFALRLDEAEMGALESLSAIPLSATVVRQEASGHWTMATGGLALGHGALDHFMAQDRLAAAPGSLSIPVGHAIAIARALPTVDGKPGPMLLLSYPLARALAPYRSLQLGIICAGLIGLILVLLGTRRLAETIARPIAALDIAARALKAGDRTEVAVVGSDEIARLAESFNSMSADIVARETQITHLAFHDVLTDLPNRVAFRQQLDTALARGARVGEPVAVFCLDLDGFKIVNDSYGHPTGDGLLRAVGAALRDVATDAFVARLSGDEFAVILAYGFDADRPRAIAQALTDRLREPVLLEGRSILSSASIGIAVAPSDGNDASTLLKNADLALYRAKQDGRGVFRFFEPGLDAAARRRRQIELDLREALHLGQLRLDYQPIFDLRSNHIGCFEALLRWTHPVRGTISPVEFIPIAEESGLIVALGEWVMQEACREAATWPGDVRVAVNVSAIQFRNNGLAQTIMQALAHSGLAPHRLEVEITESVFLDGTGVTLDLLHKLRALGVRIALDDFGTGYSSLSYLQSFPFDKIKIDRSFVSGVVDNDRAAAIVRAIVDLASAFSMETTAEGVEDEGQLEKLRFQGCSSIQGFLFSRPVSAVAAATLLREEGLHDGLAKVA